MFLRLRIRIFHFPSFSEGLSLRGGGRALSVLRDEDFPSFSEGLSLRGRWGFWGQVKRAISLPFRRDFH